MIKLVDLTNIGKRLIRKESLHRIIDLILTSDAFSRDFWVKTQNVII